MIVGAEIRNLVEKVRNTLSKELNVHQNSLTQLKFLYLMSLYVINNPGVLKNVNYKEKFAELMFNYFRQEVTEEYAFESLKQFIKTNFSSKEIFVLFSNASILARKIKEDENLVLIDLEKEELNKIFRND